MRELEFSENNLFCRWLGVKTIWELIQGEVQQSVRVTVEAALAAEVEKRVGCCKYERSEGRRGYRNGTYGRDLLTQYGWIEALQVPRVREGGLDSAVFARYQRRQRLVDLVLLQAFLRGQSTRQTRRVFGWLFGEAVSAPTVSRLVAQLGERLTRFHRQALPAEYQQVYLDGFWVTLRKPVKTKKVVLVAYGVRMDGTAEVVSFQLAARESQACWWGFLGDLKRRGLVEPGLVVTDGAAGLVQALAIVWPRARQQRCVIHKTRDAADNVLDRRHRRALQQDALWVFEQTATTETEVRKRLLAFCQTWHDREPKAVAIFRKGIEACFAYLEYPPGRQKTLKSTNPIERQIEEFRRRLIPMRSFNNATSAERIIYGLIAYVLNQNPMDGPVPEFTHNA
jgi:putative transposase